jgi:putative transposase
VKKSQSPYRGFRFPAAIISCAVRWYHRFHLSLRGVKELLLERGVEASYESERNW